MPWGIETLNCRWSRSAPAGAPAVPYRRVIMFVDNAGADVVLGMLPLARELLRSGAEVPFFPLGFGSSVFCFVVFRSVPFDVALAGPRITMNHRMFSGACNST